MLRKVSVAINVLRKNGFLGELQCLADNPPTLKMEDSANIKMVLQGTFKKNVLDRWKHYVEFDPLTDALQPVLTINGVKYELGIFLPTTVSPSYKDTDVEETIEIEAYDRSWLVATTTGTERVFFARGTAYMEAIEQLLVASGIALIKSTPCTDVLREDREDWDLGTDYLTIINDLLKEINYKQLWFDNTGTAIIEPIDTPMVKNIKHILDARNVTSLVRPGLSRKLDIYSIPNVFICTCNNPEKSAVLTAVSRNENDHSPLSIHRRGREIVYYENVNNVASQDALQAYADRLLFISLMSGESLSVTTSLLPDWGIGDIVSLHYLDIHALCVSHSWNMTLAAGGAMTHELEKIVYNLDPGIYGDGNIAADYSSNDLRAYSPWRYDNNGNNNSSTGNNNNYDDDDGDDAILPDEITIVTLPDKLSYIGENVIDLNGIVVKAYRDGKLWTNKRYPDGTIPIEELSSEFNTDWEITIKRSYTYYHIPAGTVMEIQYDADTASQLHIDSDVNYIEIESYNEGYENSGYSGVGSHLLAYYSTSPFTILETYDGLDMTGKPGRHDEWNHPGTDRYGDGLYICNSDVIRMPQAKHFSKFINGTPEVNVYKTIRENYSAYDVLKDGFPRTLRFNATWIGNELHNDMAIIVSWARPVDGHILTASYSVSTYSNVDYEPNAIPFSGN